MLGLVSSMHGEPLHTCRVHRLKGGPANKALLSVWTVEQQKPVAWWSTLPIVEF